MDVIEKCLMMEKCLLLLTFVNVVLSSVGPPCMSPLGLEFGLGEHSLTFDLAVSSGEPGSIRLNGPKAWRPENISGSYIEINMSQPVLLTALQVEGDVRMTGQISAWLLDTSSDCETYRTQHYLLDMTSPVHAETVYMKSLEFVSCIRLRPTNFKGKAPALRLELLGCVVQDTRSCGHDLHPTSEIWMENGGRQLNFGHEIVLSWVKILLDLQAHGDTGHAGIFYSKSCEHWDYYEPADTSVISPTTADGKSSWRTIELNKPVRAKCVRIFPPFATTLSEVHTSRCDPHPDPTIREPRTDRAVGHYGEDSQEQDTSAFQRDAPNVPQDSQSTSEDVRLDPMLETRHKDDPSLPSTGDKNGDKYLNKPDGLIKREDFVDGKDHESKMSVTPSQTSPCTSTAPIVTSEDTTTTALEENVDKSATNTARLEPSSPEASTITLSDILFNGERNGTMPNGSTPLLSVEHGGSHPTVHDKLSPNHEEQDKSSYISTTTDDATDTQQNITTTYGTTKQQTTETTDIVTNTQGNTTMETDTIAVDNLTTSDFVTMNPQSAEGNNTKSNDTISDTVYVTETSSVTDTKTSSVTDFTVLVKETPADHATETSTDRDSETSTALNTEASTALNTETSTAIHAEASTAIDAEMSTAIHAETSTDINTETPTVIHAETPTALNTETSTDINAETSTAINTETSTAINTETSTDINAETSTAINTETSTDINAETSTGLNTETSTVLNTETSTAIDTETSTAHVAVTNDDSGNKNRQGSSTEHDSNGYSASTGRIEGDDDPVDGTTTESPAEPQANAASPTQSLDSVMMSDSEHREGNNSECGTRRPQRGSRRKRVISGHPNKPGEWPWLVSMHYLPEFEFTRRSGFKHTCGASIIAPNWLLTAAHCFSDEMENGLSNLTSWRIFFGIHDLAREDDQSFIQERLIDSVYIYPEYDILDEPLIYDMALVKLSEAVTFSERVFPVCLDDTDIYYQERQCFVTGWGQLTTFSPGSRFPYTAALSTMTLSKCEGKYARLPDDHPVKPFVHIQPPVLCATVGSSGEDACQGDSGGPLMCERDGRWYQAGVVAAGYQCGHEATPGLYTRVTYYMDWIRKTMMLHGD